MPDERDQSAVIAFLEEGSLGPVERVDTQAAIVFLARDRGWKLKRAVDLGFLDFSTLVRRRAALEAELRLNRRTAPDLYLAVHPVAHDAAGRLALDGEGAAVDWLLEMRRFPDDALLSRVAERGELDETLAIRLAEVLQRFHAEAPIARISNGVQGLAKVIDGNAERLAALSAILPGERTDALISDQRRLLDRHGPLLAIRSQAARVRHVHGDLHADNIVVLDGQPTPFDCLEFDEALATTDVLYDLAFLLMDLWRREQREAANLVFNRYLDLSPEDEDGTALLPLFLSLRATVRAHVHATEAQAGKAGADEDAKAYLDLAAELLEPGQPVLVAIGGLSGTGKSTVARRLGAGVGRAPGARILRSDVLRKRLAGFAPEARLPAGSYTPKTATETYRALCEAVRRHLHAGQSVIADAAFTDLVERRAIAEVATSVGRPWRGMWLDAPLETRLARVRDRQADASDADEAVVRGQDEDVGPLESWGRINASGDAKKAAAAIARSLDKRPTELPLS